MLDPKIYKNGVVCADCINLTSLNAGTVIFTTPHAGGNYTVGPGKFVKRRLAYDEVEKGDNLSITLSVDVGDATFYALEESVPAGWAVVDANGLDTSEAGYLKAVVTSGAVDVNYTYILQAPEIIGQYNFSGIYAFQGDVNESAILGDDSVLVTGVYGDSNDDSEVSIIELVTYIGKWKADSVRVTIMDLIKSITFWKRGYV